jgi:hypothetical protein
MASALRFIALDSPRFARLADGARGANQAHRRHHFEELLQHRDSALAAQRVIRRVEKAGAYAEVARQLAS